MNTELLQRIGLTPSQAKAYLELVKTGSLTPPQLAKRTGESRTACYMSLAKLTEIGLADEIEEAKKQTYTPASPSVLNEILAQKRKELADIESKYRDQLPNMLSYYYTYRGKPGVRFYEGKKGLQEIYKDHLRTREYVHVLRTPADIEFGDVLFNYLDKRVALGVGSDMLSPEEESAVHYAKHNDQRLKRTTSWFPQQYYTAPVEISIYGKKVSMISFGEEAVGIIIESPQIADAMRQLYAMAKVGAQTLQQQEAKA
jgi:sugar-specific transcriptional regulator TrmB